MSSGSSFDTKQRVKQAVDIVELVGSYLPLRREGRIFKALCPWHDDTRPSLQVNPDRQSFKCWVCALGGDVFSFLMKMEGVTFPEALAMLAERAGITLDKGSRSGAPAPADDKRVLYQAHAWANQQYHDFLLKSAEAEPARKYLADRKISGDSIRKFQLGCAADDWNWLSERVRGTPYSQAVLERVGLISRRRQGPGYYDRFKGRVLFPILDAQARAVGLGGRIMPGAPDDAAKYLNTAETPLFIKNQLLYGLSLARDAIHKNGTALVTEGYTDCIVAHQFGFENTVAVLGTALTANHVNILRRYGDRVRVILLLDGDEAGRKRAREVLELFVAGNVDLRVLTLPDQLDPADFLLRDGASALSELVEAAPDALSFAFRAVTTNIDLANDLQSSMRALDELVTIIAKAPRLRADTKVEDRLREEKFLQRLAVDFRLPEQQVRTLLTEKRRRTAARPMPAPAADASGSEKIDPLERELLEIVLHFPHFAGKVAGSLQPAQFTSATCRGVWVRCAQLTSQGILPDFERLLLEIDDPVVKNLLVELDETGRQKSAAEIEVRLQDVLAGFERRQADQWMRGQTLALKQRQFAEEDELAVLVELERHQRARQQQQSDRLRQDTSEPTDG